MQAIIPWTEIVQIPFLKDSAIPEFVFFPAWSEYQSETPLSNRITLPLPIGNSAWPMSMPGNSTRQSMLYTKVHPLFGDTKYTVAKLVRGLKEKCKDIGEILAREETLKEE